MEAIAKVQANTIPEEELAEIKSNVRTCDETGTIVFLIQVIR
jgi:tartrate dehydratase alpha subunit/fumarate hydratase class I-like protein